MNSKYLRCPQCLTTYCLDGLMTQNLNLEIMVRDWKSGRTVLCQLQRCYNSRLMPCDPIKHVTHDHSYNVTIPDDVVKDIKNNIEKLNIELNKIIPTIKSQLMQDVVDFMTAYEEEKESKKKLNK